MKEPKRKTRHDLLEDEVTARIDDLFSDTTVSRQKTAESLRAIIDDCYIRIDSLGRD